MIRHTIYSGGAKWMKQGDPGEFEIFRFLPYRTTITVLIWGSTQLLLSLTQKSGFLPMPYDNLLGKTPIRFLTICLSNVIIDFWLHQVSSELHQ